LVLKIYNHLREYTEINIGEISRGNNVCLSFHILPNAMH